MAKKKVRKSSKRKIKIPKLSNKPSEMICQALKDLSSVEKMKSVYEIDMNNWHVPAETPANHKCEVCFAGSIIAMSGNDPGMPLRPSSFPTDVKAKLEALNCFRTGGVREGFGKLDIKTPRFLADDVDVADYDLDPKKFKADMRELAKVFAATGY